MVNNLVQMRSLWQQFPTAELPERLAMWERFSRNEPLNKTAPLKPLPPSPEAPPAPVEETVKKESENVGALENGPEQERPKKKAGKKGDESAKKSEDAGGKTSAEKKGGKASAEKKGAKASPEKKGGKGKKVSDEAPAGGDGETSQEEKPVKKVKRKQPPKEEPAPAPKKAKLDLEKDPEAEPSSQNDAPNQVADESQSFQPLRVLAAVRGALLDSESPALSTSEVEEAVRENPGDPSVLSAPAPGFTEIVRAALRALSTKPVDLGTKKALAKFDRESKTWAWTGPRPLADEDLGAAETGAGAWRIEPEFQKQVVDNFLTRLKQPKKEPVSEAPANADPGEAPGPSESEKVEPAGGSGRGEEEEGGKKQVKRRVKKEEGQEKEKGGAAKGAVVPPPLKSTPEQLERFQKEEWMRYMAPEKTFR